MRDAAGRFVLDAEALAQATKSEPDTQDVRELRRTGWGRGWRACPGGRASELGRRRTAGDGRRRRAGQARQAAADQHLYETDAEVKRICDWLEGQSRFELVRDALLSPGTGLLAQARPRRAGDRLCVRGETDAARHDAAGIARGPARAAGHRR